jgi:hypothetical protein
MRKISLIVLMTFICLQSCNSGKYEITINDNIDDKLKNEINDLDKLIIKGLSENNSSVFKDIFSDELKKKFDSKFNLWLEKNSEFFTSNKCEVLDQFYVKNNTSGIITNVFTKLTEPNGYTVTYLAINKETFVSQVIIEIGMDKFLLTNIYGKYREGWKLNILKFGQYAINGKTAIELYTEAETQYEKGYIIDAYLNLNLCFKVIHPSESYLKYSIEDEITGFNNLVLNVIKDKYNFPLTINSIDTKPQVFNIYPYGTPEGYFPFIEYISTIDLKKTSDLKIENDKIHNSIGKVFNGLDKNKKNIIYKAYNTLPDGKTPIPAYGFVKEYNLSSNKE